MLLWGYWGWRWEEKVHGGLSEFLHIAIQLAYLLMFYRATLSACFHLIFTLGTPMLFATPWHFDNFAQLLPSQEVAACPWPTGQWQDHDATRSGASARRGVSASRGHRGHLQ